MHQNGTLDSLRCFFRKNGLILVLAVCLAVQALFLYTVCDSDGLLLLNCLAIVGLVAINGFHSLLSAKGVKYVNEKTFAAVLLIFGMSYMLFFPPGTVPDEPHHFEVSYRWSSALLFSPDWSSDTLLMREDVARFVENADLYGTSVELGRYHSLLESFQFFSEASGYVDAAATSSFDFGGNPPQLKIISAMGIAFARIANLGAIPLFYAGRIANLLFFVALAYCSVRVSPVAKKTFMVVSLLPMTLHLVSSYSYDSGIIGIAFLLSAYCLRAIYGDRKVSKRDMVVMVALVVLLAPCKVVYTLIALLAFLIPSSRFSSKRESLLFKGVFFVCAIAAIALLRLNSLLGMAGVDGSAGSLDHRGTEVGSFFSLADILSDPIGVAVMYLRTFASQGDFYLSTAVGGSLGWFQPDLAMRNYVVFALLIMVAISALRSKDDSVQVPASHRLACFGLSFACWVAVMTSMLVGWTFTSETIIQGVQGRYLIPVLPILLIAARSRVVEIGTSLTFKLVLCMSGFNVAYLASLASRIIS